MDEERKRLLEQFERRSTEELISILRNRDDEEWRPEVFEIVAEVLGARGESTQSVIAIEPQQRSPEEAQLEGVGFERRVLARCLDLVIHYGVAFCATLVVTLLIVVGAGIQGVSPNGALQRLSVVPPLGYFAGILGSFLMHALSEGLHGSTLGKRICGIVVIGENGDSPATIVGGFKRSLAFYWDGLFFGIVAWGAMSKSPKRQRVGDVWGRTMVVRVSAVPPSARRSLFRFAAATVTGISANGLVVVLEMASRFI